MKKKYLTICILAPLAILASCDGQAASSTSNTPVEEESTLTSNLKTLSNSVLLSGSVVQTRQYATATKSDGTYTWSATKETNEYATTIGFSSKGRNAIYKYSIQDYMGEETVIEDYTYFEDEEGYAYSESLNYKNELERNYSINLTTTSFASNGFYNPFSILNEEDFTLQQNGNYNLDLNKAEIISNNLLYSLNSGFAGSVKEAYFTIVDNSFSHFVLTMDSYIYYDSTYSYTYKVENTVDFVISRAGTYMVQSEEQYSDKGYTSLAKALSDLGNNYTLSVEMYNYDQVKGEESTTYQDFYFTGSEIYVHSYDNANDDAPDKAKDFYLSPDEDGTLYSYVYNTETSEWEKKTTTAFPSLYQGKNTYNDYLPNAYEVSSDLFKYDGENKCYVAEDNATSALVECFYPNVAPFRKSASNSFYDVEVVLNNDKISLVTLPFSYTHFQSASIQTGRYNLSYTNIGTTVNPK